MLEISICNKLGLDPTQVIKKKIRGLEGITVYQLIKALINSDNVQNASEYLGYTANPVKIAIREVLKPALGLLPGTFGTNSGVFSWRYELLKCIQYKYCNTCCRTLPYIDFHINKTKAEGISANCAKCRVVDSKKRKFYIAERTPQWANLELIKQFYSNCPKNYEVDHIVPLRGVYVSGLNVLENLQYLPSSENRSKSNTYHLE